MTREEILLAAAANPMTSVYIMSYSSIEPHEVAASLTPGESPNTLRVSTCAGYRPFLMSVGIEEADYTPYAIIKLVAKTSDELYLSIDF